MMRKQSICIADGCGKPFDSRGPEGNPFAFADRYCLDCVAKRVKKNGVSEPIVEKKEEKMTRKRQINLINEAFDAIPDLQDGFYDVRERLFKMNIEAEREHRTGRTASDCGIPVKLAAKLFTVQHLLDGWNDPRWTIDDILNIRTECLYAQAYASRHHEELRDWAAKYTELFKPVDYAFLMKKGEN